MTGTWEQAVREFCDRSSPIDVENNYFDTPGIEAARRFAKSPEFAFVQEQLGPAKGRTVLDLGAGTGIASFAFAQAGWKVIAIEPDGSATVGAESIASLAKESSGEITVIRATGEALPLHDGCVDVVYARQALHHSRDLDMLISDAARVLRRRGLFLACREHIVDDELQLQNFLASHPLHKHFGGENAFPLKRYLSSARAAGLVIQRVWGPEASIVNFYPGSPEDLKRRWIELASRTWRPFGRYLAWSGMFQRYAVSRSQKLHPAAGRLTTFLWKRA